MVSSTFFKNCFELEDFGVFNRDNCQFTISVWCVYIGLNLIDKHVGLIVITSRTSIRLKTISFANKSHVHLKNQSRGNQKKLLVGQSGLLDGLLHYCFEFLCKLLSETERLSNLLAVHSSLADQEVVCYCEPFMRNFYNPSIIFFGSYQEHVQTSCLIQRWWLNNFVFLMSIKHEHWILSNKECV